MGATASLLVSLGFELLGCRFPLLRIHPLPTADRLRLASSHLRPVTRTGSPCRKATTAPQGIPLPPCTAASTATAAAATTRRPHAAASAGAHTCKYSRSAKPRADAIHQRAERADGSDRIFGWATAGRTIWSRTARPSTACHACRPVPSRSNEQVAPSTTAASCRRRQPRTASRARTPAGTART